jgi:hypothetical protein
MQWTQGQCVDPLDEPILAPICSGNLGSYVSLSSFGIGEVGTIVDSSHLRPVSLRSLQGLRGQIVGVFYESDKRRSSEDKILVSLTFLAAQAGACEQPKPNQSLVW